MLRAAYRGKDICILTHMRCRAFFGRYKTSKYFGTDGFRGEAGVTITAVQAFKCGRVLGWYFGANMGKKCRAVIGKDTRLSSYTLEYALAAGVTCSGGDAYILHVTTTPSVSYIARCDGFDCGVMISASHNGYRDNGIKLFNSQGEKLSGGVISLIERYLDGDLQPFGGDIPLAAGKDVGRTVDYISGRNRYTGHLISLSTCSYKGYKIGLDCANGSAFNIARSVFDALGAKTYIIGGEPDGTNINGGVGSTHIGALRKLVIENSLDLGFAFDGDADRCIAVDSRGEVVTGDEILYICAVFLKNRGELIDNKTVCTVMSNGGLISSLKNMGIDAEICGVGDGNVCAAMRETGAVLGGERSGHIVFSKYETTGDGLLTAIMLMEAVIAQNCNLYQLLKGYRPLGQINCSIPCTDKLRAMRGVAELAGGLEKEYGVRIVVRPSGTEPMIRLMAEGENPADCERAVKILSDRVTDNCKEY